jgi:glycosyltransferase involved in cell wall biosynthesis
MKDKKRILIIAGCTDKKLISKISPVLDSKYVEKVYLVRNTKMQYSHFKLVQYSVFKPFRKILPLRELNRVISSVYILLFKRIDIILSIHFLMHGVYGYFLSKIFKKKHIFLFIESPRKYKKDKLMLKMLKNAEIIGVRGSDSMQYLLEKGIAKDKIFIPPNEFEIHDIGIRKEKKIYDLIYIGNFVDVKDLPLWVDTVECIKRDIPNIKCIMVGDGERFNDIKERIHSKGLKDNIELVGRKNNVNEYIKKSKLLLMTSKSEGLPMVVVECMAYGVPAVVPNVGDVKDLVIHGKNGIIVNKRDAKEFAKEIINILEDGEKYTEMSLESVESIKKMMENTSHDRVTYLWDALLKNI